MISLFCQKQLCPFRPKNLVYEYSEQVGQFMGLHKPCFDAKPYLQPPFAQKQKRVEHAVWKVNNLFFTKLVADFFDSEVIIGLEEQDKENFLSAFFVKKGAEPYQRYDKRVLLPVAEYLPGAIFKKLALRYGMSQFFTHGTKAKVFEGKSAYYPTICYEECFGHKVREGKKRGGRLLINLSNDAWYPKSKLNYCHFDHGKLRSIENGVYQIRACNTGITAAIDPFGKIVAELKSETEDVEAIRDALVVELPHASISTLYAYLGDITIVTICFAFIAFFGLHDQYKRKKT